MDDKKLGTNVLQGRYDVTSQGRLAAVEGGIGAVVFVSGEIV